MQTETSSLEPQEDCPHKPDHNVLTCNGCGKSVADPILAHILTAGHTQSYHACPHCMTRLKITAARKTEDKKPTVSGKEATKPEGKSEGNIKCQHSFGYLNKRQKGSPVPEQCLTCTRMVDCLYG